jgi:hypothetical protein
MCRCCSFRNLGCVFYSSECSQEDYSFTDFEEEGQQSDQLKTTCSFLPVGYKILCTFRYTVKLHSNVTNYLYFISIILRFQPMYR